MINTLYTTNYVLGFAESASVKQKSSNQVLLIDHFVCRAHKIIIGHWICQIQNALSFFGFCQLEYAVITQCYINPECMM